MKIISVNVSMPKTVDHEGRKVSTGIYKEPVDGRVMIRKLNLDGDGQADLSVHGGVYKAVYVYDLESYRYWERELGRNDFHNGHFGENLTVEGMPDDQIHIGDVFQVGSALLEVAQPRTPCFKLEMKMGLPGFSRQFLISGRLGFYFRVLEEGEVGAGDSIERVTIGPEQITVREFAHLYYFDYDNQEKIRRVLRLPTLPPEWRRTFEELLATAGNRAKKDKVRTRAWKGFRPFVVDQKVRESHDITSFYLVSEDGETLPVYMPGQFLTFKLSIPGNPKPVIRNYSLSDSPFHPEYYRTTIKREPPPDDLSVISASNFFHDQVEPGTKLQVAAPRGDFYLDPQEESPVVLLSGGVGLTPMISMLNAIVETGIKRPVWFIHGTRNGIHHAMCKHMRQVTEANDNIKLHIRYSRPQPEDLKGRDYDSIGHVTVDLLEELLPDKDWDFYICGPPPFMKSLMKDLQGWGVSGNRIHIELFGPASLLQEGIRPKHKRPRKKLVTGEEIFEIVFLQSGITAKWDAAYENLLDFIEDQGVFPDFSCRSGICHTCMYELIEGEVEYSFEPLDPPYPGQILLCCTRPRSNLVIDI
jgi:ferredoxin-NADP reductase/MOSC domain-containing protein YiiM/ferredoxin